MADTVTYNTVTDAMTYNAMADATVANDPVPDAMPNADMPDSNTMPDSDTMPNANVAHPMCNTMSYSTNSDPTMTNTSTVNAASGYDTAACK